MADKDLNIQLLINEYTENYVEKIFYFCLKKTGSVYDAQDLSSDITVNILQSLNKGIIPVSYTHLDVYKRQDIPSSFASGHITDMLSSI